MFPPHIPTTQEGVGKFPGLGEGREKAVEQSRQNNVTSKKDGMTLRAWDSAGKFGTCGHPYLLAQI